MQKITPFLWFDSNAEEAVNFYASVFKKSKIDKMVRMGADQSDTSNAVLTAEFEIEGIRFVALNGGPMYTFTEAVSFVINCDSQEEVDYYWEKLLDGGQAQMCGWLKDKFGLSWQVVPRQLIQLMQHPDADKRKRVMDQMLKMVKLDITTLENA